MERVAEAIARHGEDRNTVFVFPSEVVAGFWREKSLLLGSKKAVRSDRFLSWDRFKENLFDLTRDTRPVNSIHRLLFAASLMEENRTAATPLFSTVIDPRYRSYSSRYTDSIVAALPGLQTMIQRISMGRKILEPGLQQDVQLLWAQYNRFLETYGLFEPEHEEFSPVDRGAKSFVFYPEIVQDYSRFAPQLERVESVVPVPAADTGRGELIYFDNALQEIRYVLSSIEDLLLSGAGADSIGVTLADPALLPHFRHEAALRGIPLSIRSGEVLSRYPAGRLFLHLQETIGTDYSFESVKNLVINRRYPWKAAAAGEELAAFGVSQFCLRGEDEWKSRIASYGNPFLADYFANLTRCLSAIRNGSTFREVKQQSYRFFHTFFDTAGWEAEDEAVFQSCINVLNDMIEAERSLPGIAAADPFSLFMKTLSSRVYVPRERSGGVAVFPYRVTAGTGLSSHFVAGVSETAVSVIQAGFPYLREDQKKQLGLEETDFTEAFLQVYTGSGEQVVFTGSREGVSGSHRAPAFFLRQGAVRPRLKGDLPKSPDLYRQEAEVWRNQSAPFPSRLYPIQQEGLLRAAAGCLAEKGEDYAARSVADPGLQQKLMDLQKEEQSNLPRISPTRLEEYTRCPFRYLFSSVLDAAPDEYDSKLDDPKIAGIVYHTVLAELYSSIQAGKGRFDPGELEDYRQQLQECIEHTFNGWKNRGGYFMPPLASLFRRKTEELLALQLDRESDAFPGFEIVSCEHTESFPSEELGAYLTGRIDRISRNTEGTLLIDYKKKNRLNRNDLLGETPVSFQMPFYALLAREAGMEVAHIAYYDIEGKKFTHVLRPPPGKSWTDGEGLQGLIEKTRDAVRNMITALNRGSYQCTRDSKRCSRCEYRRICRERYVLG